MRKFPSALIGLGLVLAHPALAAGVRDFTRSTQPGTAINEAQASELTLTLTEAAMRPIQHWVRTAGTLDSSGKIITAFVRSPEGELVQVGQRLRSFSVMSRTRMHLGKITQVTKKPGGATVEATLPVQAGNDGSRYVMEIVVERGPFLSIPNVSIIEEEDEHIVYVQKEAGRYVSQAIEIGLQGELYTQVLGGLKEGDQVVSVGSFFVDAENKLKLAGMAPMPGMDHGSMPGMNHAPAPQAGATAAASTASGTAMTDPAANARVQAPLYMIHVMFNQRVDPKASGFEITDSSGKAVETGAPTLMGNEGNMLMAMPKTPLPAGAYKVKWHTVGADAKSLQGEFSFTVQ